MHLLIQKQRPDCSCSMAESCWWRLTTFSQLDRGFRSHKHKNISPISFKKVGHARHQGHNHLKAFPPLLLYDGSQSSWLGTIDFDDKFVSPWKHRTTHGGNPQCIDNIPPTGLQQVSVSVSNRKVVKLSNSQGLLFLAHFTLTSFVHKSVGVSWLWYYCAVVLSQLLAYQRLFDNVTLT